MNCFYHPKIVAVGICRNCQKGLCLECAADLKNGIACKGKCEREVTDIIEMIQRNKKAYETASDSQFRAGFFWLIIGGASILVSLKAKAPDAFLFFGIAFLVISAWNILAGYKYRKISEKS